MHYCKRIISVSYTHLDVYKRQVVLGAKNALDGFYTLEELETSSKLLYMIEKYGKEEFQTV